MGRPGSICRSSHEHRMGRCGDASRLHRLITMGQTCFRLATLARGKRNVMVPKHFLPAASGRGRCREIGSLTRVAFISPFQSSRRRGTKQTLIPAIQPLDAAVAFHASTGPLAAPADARLRLGCASQPVSIRRSAQSRGPAVAAGQDARRGPVQRRPEQPQRGLTS